MLKNRLLVAFCDADGRAEPRGIAHRVGAIAH
jgi:hypothetical protein